jgi:hypothetical protein
MIIAPDDTFTAAEAAPYLRKSTRQVQRMLNDGLVHGVRRNGRWTLTALAIWRYFDIDEDMMKLWFEYCTQEVAKQKSEE